MQKSNVNTGIFKKDTEMLRVLKIKEGKALVVDCVKSRMPCWINQSDWDNAVEISEDDLLEELHLQFAGKKNARKKAENEYAMLEKREKGLYEQLDYIPKSREELLQKTGFLPQELAGILVSLELKGMIKEVSKDYFVRNK